MELQNIQRSRRFLRSQPCTKYTEIEPKLASEIETPAKTFEVYLKKVDILQPEYHLSINELKEAFFSLQANKSPDHDEVSFNVINPFMRLISFYTS